MNAPSSRRFFCPHCLGPCVVDDKHVGGLVRCSKCGKNFTARATDQADAPSTEPVPTTAGALRLGIAGVTSSGHKRSRNEDSFLVQHLSWFENRNFSSASSSWPTASAGTPPAK